MYTIIGSTMGWEQINGKRYYFEVKSVGGEKVRTYRGTGPEAKQIAARVEQENKKRKADIVLVQKLRLRDLQIDSLVHTFNQSAHGMAQAALARRGYYYVRSKWRKRNHK